MAREQRWVAAICRNANVVGVCECLLVPGTHARKEGAALVGTPCMADLEAWGIPGPDGSDVADFAAKRHVDGGEGVGVDVLRLVIQLLVE